MENETTSTQDIFTSDFYKQYRQSQLDKLKSVKSGPNVIHLEFLGELEPDELNEINLELNGVGLELSYYNKSGLVFNTNESSLVSFIIIGQQILEQVLSGETANATWDTIRSVTLKIQNKVNSRKRFVVTDENKVEQPIAFGLRINFNGNVTIDFELDGSLGKEALEESLDKILLFLKGQNQNSLQNHNFLRYVQTKKNWEVLDTTNQKQNSD